MPFAWRWPPRRWRRCSSLGAAFCAATSRATRAFMIRAYALGQGAGTQVLVLLPWMLLSGESGGLTRDLLMTLSWAINIVVAESIIRFRGPATLRSAVVGS